MKKVRNFFKELGIFFGVMVVAVVVSAWVILAIFIYESAKRGALWII